MSELENHVIFLQNQLPKIDEAVKNIISMILARSVTSSDTDVLYSGAIVYTPSQSLTCARILLKSIQNTSLDDYMTWSTSYPQLSHQTAIDRLDQLNHYKSVAFLRDKVISSKQSINKFFGKSYFLWTSTDVWSNIRLNALNSDRSDVSLDQLTQFINIFEESLERDDDIIWSSDFRTELYNRSHQRKQDILQRNNQPTSDEEVITEISSIIS